MDIISGHLVVTALILHAIHL